MVPRLISMGYLQGIFLLIASLDVCITSCIFSPRCSKEYPRVRPRHPPILENRVSRGMVGSLCVTRTDGSKIIWMVLSSLESNDLMILDSISMVLQGVLHSWKREFQTYSRRSKTSPPSAREAAMSAMQHEIFWNTLEVFLKLPWNTFETPLKIREHPWSIL